MPLACFAVMSLALALGGCVIQFGTSNGADLILGFSTAQGDKLDFGGQTYTVSDDGNNGTLFDVRSRGLMVHSSCRFGRMRYGPGTARERPHDRGDPSTLSSIVRRS
jgi:hypothetical protein